MRDILSACALCCGIFSMPDADAAVLINIDLSSQTMHVSSDMGSYDWAVSTARSELTGRRAGEIRPYQFSCACTLFAQISYVSRRCLIPSFSRPSGLCDPWHL